MPARVRETRGGLTNPYADNKTFHFGFSLGTNFMSFGVTDRNLPILSDGSIGEPGQGGQYYHARVSSLTPGFSVGFISDLRLCKYVNLRFTPTLHFSTRSISYVNENGMPVKGSPNHGSTASMLSLPIDIPLYFKFSSQRLRNARPYVIAGGGFQYNTTRDHEKPVMLKGPDAFVAVGAGCDIYFAWFKLCPEIKYHIGFCDVLTPIEERTEVGALDKFYTQAIRRLTNQMLTITFNFE